MAFPEMTGEKLCRDVFQDLLAQEKIKTLDGMSKFKNTRSQMLLCFNCHKQKAVKDGSLLQEEYLEKVETLEIKIQAATQSRAIAKGTAESPLLLDMPGRSHLYPSTQKYIWTI